MRPRFVGLAAVATLVAVSLTTRAVTTARAAEVAVTIEQHFAHTHPPEVLAGYPPRLRAVLEQRMRAERRRARDASDPLAAWARERITWMCDRLEVASAFWSGQ